MEKASTCCPVNEFKCRLSIQCIAFQICFSIRSLFSSYWFLNFSLEEHWEIFFFNPNVKTRGKKNLNPLKSEMYLYFHSWCLLPTLQGLCSTCKGKVLAEIHLVCAIHLCSLDCHFKGIFPFKRVFITVPSHLLVVPDPADQFSGSCVALIK